MFKNIITVFTYALPISVSSVIYMLSNFIAMLMVSKLGNQALAAGALGVTSYTTVLTLVVTIFYAISILISHAKGHAKQEKEIGVFVNNGLWLALMLAIPSCLIIWNMDKLLLLFGQDADLISLTQEYFYYAGLTLFPILAGNVVSHFYSGNGNPKFVLMLSLIGLPFNVLLSYGLIYGHFGLTAVGLGGITCATFIVQSVTCIVTLLMLKYQSKYRNYHILTGQLAPNWTIIKKILLLGMPIGVQFGGELAAMTVATYFMGYFGVNALAASQIVHQCSLLVIMVILGISQALSILTSKAYSNHQYSLIKQYVSSSMLIFLAFLSFITILFFFQSESLISLFIDIEDINNSELLSLTQYLFYISTLFLLVDGLRNILSGGLRGLQDSKTPMIIGVICLWIISLPICYWIGFSLEGGPIGLRLGFVSGFALASLILFFRMKNKCNDNAINSRI